MSTTRIADLVEPTEFAEYTLERSATKSTFFSSGIVANNTFASEVEGGGRYASMPHIKDIDSGASNVDSDDPDADATPGKASSGLVDAFKHNRNKSIEGADLASIVAGTNPLTTLADRFITYWDREYQTVMLQSSLGVLADNIANDSGDMVHVVSNDSSDALALAEQLTGDTMVEAMQTMGDSKSDLVAVGIHSRIHANLQKQGLLLEHFDLETGALLFETFMGKRVIMNDNMPVVAGTNRLTYTSILFAAGAFGHGEGSPLVPVETDRNAKGGNGGGIEWITTRRKFMLHPAGISFVGKKSAGFAAEGPTNAELAAAANWNREYERKNIKLAFIKTNG